MGFRKKEAYNRYFKDLAKSFNPIRYDRLSNNRIKNSFKYIFATISIALLLTLLVSIPMLRNLKTGIKDKISGFEEFNIDISTEKPILFTENIPIIAVDTKTNNTSPVDSYVLVGEDFVSYKFWFKQGIIDTTGHSDVIANSDRYSKLFSTMLILMLPSLLILFYLTFLIKYLILAVVASLVILFITRMLKFDISYKQSLNVCIYAATIPIFLDLIRLPFNINIYYAHFIIFAVYIILGVIKAGRFEAAKTIKIKPGGKQ